MTGLANVFLLASLTLTSFAVGADNCLGSTAGGTCPETVPNHAKSPEVEAETEGMAASLLQRDIRAETWTFHRDVPECVARQYYNMFPDGHASVEELAKDCDKIRTIDADGCSAAVRKVLGKFVADGCRMAQPADSSAARSSKVPECVAEQYNSLFPDGHANPEELVRDCDKIKTGIDASGCDSKIREVLEQFVARGCRLKDGASLFQQRAATPVSGDYDYDHGSISGDYDYDYDHDSTVKSGAFECHVDAGGSLNCDAHVAAGFVPGLSVMKDDLLSQAMASGEDWYGISWANGCRFAVGVDVQKGTIGNWVPPNCRFECNILSNQKVESQNFLACVEQVSNPTSSLLQKDGSQNSWASVFIPAGEVVVEAAVPWVAEKVFGSLWGR